MQRKLLKLLWKGWVFLSAVPPIPPFDRSSPFLLREPWRTIRRSRAPRIHPSASAESDPEVPLRKATTVTSTTPDFGEETENDLADAFGPSTTTTTTTSTTNTTGRRLNPFRSFRSCRLEEMYRREVLLVGRIIFFRFCATGLLSWMALLITIASLTMPYMAQDSTLQVVSYACTFAGIAAGLVSLATTIPWDGAVFVKLYTTSPATRLLVEIMNTSILVIAPAMNLCFTPFGDAVGPVAAVTMSFLSLASGVSGTATGQLIRMMSMLPITFIKIGVIAGLNSHPLPAMVVYLLPFIIEGVYNFGKLRSGDARRRQKWVPRR